MEQFIEKLEAFEKRLQKLEVIHTRYTGDRGPQGPKGEKGDKGDPADFNEVRAEKLAFRAELREFKNEMLNDYVQHRRDLEETYRGHAEELSRMYSEQIESFCKLLRDEAAKRENDKRVVKAENGKQRCRECGFPAPTI
jgi:hypothetical protein